MNTFDSGAAAPIAQAGISREAFTLLRGRSPVLRLQERGMRTVPPNVAIPRELNTGVGAAWIMEGGPTPVIQNAFNTLSTTLNKYGAAVVLSRELVLSPGAELIATNLLIRISGGFRRHATARSNDLVGRPPATCEYYVRRHCHHHHGRHRRANRRGFGCADSGSDDIWQYLDVDHDAEDSRHHRRPLGGDRHAH